MVGCVVYCSTEIVEPGVIRHIEGTRFAIGEPGGGPDERCRAISEAFVAGGLRCPVETTCATQIWLKLVGNAAFNPITTLTGATLGELGGMPEACALSAGDAGVRSGRRGAGHRAPGIARAAARGGARGRRPPDVDAAGLEAGKPLEIDCMTGAVAEIADMTGVPVPTVRALHELTKSVEELRDA